MNGNYLELYIQTEKNVSKKCIKKVSWIVICSYNAVPTGKTWLIKLLLHYMTLNLFVKFLNSIYEECHSNKTLNVPRVDVLMNGIAETHNEVTQASSWFKVTTITYLDCLFSIFVNISKRSLTIPLLFTFRFSSKSGHFPNFRNYFW